MQHQENISVDSVIDRCLVANYELDAIADILDAVFGNANYDVAFVQARVDRVEKYKAQLAHLLTLPKLEQRTPEWHEARQTLITASDFAQALGDGKFGTREQLLRKKCGYEEDKFNAAAPALKWGTMLEPVANEVYAQRNKMAIHEFGLLKHPDISHFGASPDGVNECGIMVEIKCPFRRKIDGTVPLQYFYQIQGQLDVTGLEECDYFECEFMGSEDVEEIFFEDQGGEKGVVIEYAGDEFVYSPTRYSWIGEELASWVESNTKSSSPPVKILYYRLEKCSTIRVYKDETFLKEKLARLADVWDKVLEYRADEALYNRELKKGVVEPKAGYKNAAAPFKGTWAFD